MERRLAGGARAGPDRSPRPGDLPDRDDGRSRGDIADVHDRRAGELFGPRVADIVAFFQAQRDGPDVIPGAAARKPSHLNDAHRDVYDWPTYENPDSDVIVGAR